MITIDLTMINTIILLVICGVYLKNNYVVLKKEDYDTIADYVQSTQEEETQEAPGGAGFFREYVDNDIEEE